MSNVQIFQYYTYLRVSEKLPLFQKKKFQHKQKFQHK